MRNTIITFVPQRGSQAEGKGFAMSNANYQNLSLSLFLSEKIFNTDDKCYIELGKMKIYNNVNLNIII